MVTVSSLASVFARVDGYLGWSLYLLLSLYMSVWMVNQGGHCLSGWVGIHGGHCVFSYIPTGQGRWSIRVVIDSSLASTFMRVDGKSGWSLIPLLPLHWSGWMVNQGGRCILSCLYIGPGGW